MHFAPSLRKVNGQITYMPQAFPVLGRSGSPQSQSDTLEGLGKHKEGLDWDLWLGVVPDVFAILISAVAAGLVFFAGRH